MGRNLRGSVNLPKAECCRTGRCVHAQQGSVLYIGEAVGKFSRRKLPKDLRGMYDQVIAGAEKVKEVARGEA